MNNQVFRLIALIAVVFYSTVSPAQDVYNFYFNKNTKPGAVNLQPNPNAATPAQAPAVNPAPPSIVAPSTVAPATTQGSIAPVTLAKSSFKKWELGFGTYSYSNWGDVDDSSNRYIDHYHNAEGLGLVGSRRLNKYISLDASVASLEDSELGVDFLYLAVGAAITPIRINLFGHDLIEMSLQLGLQTNNDVFREENLNTFEMSDVQERVTIDPYFGAKIGVNMTKELALVAESKTSRRDNIEFYSGSLSLRYRF